VLYFKAFVPAPAAETTEKNPVDAFKLATTLPLPSDKQTKLLPVALIGAAAPLYEPRMVLLEPVVTELPELAPINVLVMPVVTAVPAVLPINVQASPVVFANP